MENILIAAVVTNVVICIYLMGRIGRIGKFNKDIYGRTNQLGRDMLVCLKGYHVIVHKISELEGRTK